MNNKIDFENPEVINRIKFVYHIYKNKKEEYCCEKRKVAYINKKYVYLINQNSDKLLLFPTSYIEYNPINNSDFEISTGLFINKPDDDIIRQANSKTKERQKFNNITKSLYDIRNNVIDIGFELDSLNNSEINLDDIKNKYFSLYNELEGRLLNDISNR
ncbi:MAG: hypothetical protein ACI4SM_00225 [Candidatus Gastranaerophilaceae bacterium]